MKCIAYKDGKAVRCSNQLAQWRVDDGIAEYISKSQWRALGGEYEGPMKSKGKVSIHPPRGWVDRSNR
ncbi:MAG: hypothetical protein Tp118SUR00d2C21406231_57 [Prokaryotic dsDNA virus sp.]|nr:MAG: hypothetical protein Tp125DCM00d2C40298531_76 [Prokaryotic dsDNA virus sp.]QDP53177.1 MAG: hypothetical protein Tp118SUR00d2C21406231_57 [Prokaryotic dsDNA virus sp.]|tara:strand:+ start:30531 stop:30734 length:204 start_codon:yes stop_codon:yes gene_type:complete